jgi:predicted transcriptional regulator
VEANLRAAVLMPEQPPGSALQKDARVSVEDLRDVFGVHEMAAHRFTNLANTTSPALPLREERRGRHLQGLRNDGWSSRPT